MSSGVITPSYTPRTTAFASATAITDTTILNALNTFDLGLISNGLDTKMKALYPFVGGTSTTHKYNFMNPVDSDAAFRLQFNGGWTHSSTGALPNGTNGYANTFFTFNTSLLLNDTHISYYSRTNVNLFQCEIGTYDGIETATLMLISETGTTYYRVNTIPYMTTSSTNSLGLYIANRTEQLVTNGWKNGVKVVSATHSTSYFNNTTLSIGAMNAPGGNLYYTTKQCAFSSVGNGLTDGEASTFYTLVQNLQIALTRNV